MSSRLPPPRSFASQVQFLLLIDPIGSLVVIFPSLPSQQCMNAPVTIPNPRLGNLPDPPAKWLVFPPARPVIVCRMINQQHIATTTNRYFVLVPQMISQLLLLADLQNFFLSHPAASVCPRSNPPLSA